MNQSIKILHIDSQYEATYFVCRSGSSIQFALNLQEAINLLNTIDLDLILSEPHNRAILNHSQPDGTTVGGKDTFLGDGESVSPNKKLGSSFPTCRPNPAWVSSS